MTLKANTLNRLIVGLGDPGAAKDIGDYFVALDASISSLGGAGVATFGVFGVTPIAQVSAYTMTYNTAAKTSPAATSHAITDSTGGTPSTTALAAQAATVAAADVDTTAAQKAAVDTQLAVIRNNIATLAAELALDKADALALKKLIVAVITDLKAYGFFV